MGFFFVLCWKLASGHLVITCIGLFTMGLKSIRAPSNEYYFSCCQHNPRSIAEYSIAAVVKSRERAGRQGTTGLSEATIVTTGVVAGLLFGLHPIHVESVAWASERKDLLCAFFFLLSLLAYIKYARFTTAQRKVTKPVSWLSDKHYLLSLGFFVLALLSKSMAVTLPVVLLIVDWYPMSRFRKDTLERIVMEKVIFFVLAVNAGIIAILAQ